MGKKSPKDFAKETELIPAAITTASYLLFPLSKLIKMEFNFSLTLLIRSWQKVTPFIFAESARPRTISDGSLTLAQ